MREWSAKVRIANLADRQSGRVGWYQLVALGVDDSSISRWAASGYLHRSLPRVYAVGHHAPSAEADLTAAVLYAGPGAMLSHATALWWRGLLDHQPWPIEVSTPRRCRSLTGVDVHGRRDCRRVWHKRLPTTTIEQATARLRRGGAVERVRYVLANADYLKVLDLPALQVIAGPGRAGSRSSERRWSGTSRSSRGPGARSSGCSFRSARSTGSRCPMTSTSGSPASWSTRSGGSSA